MHTKLFFGTTAFALAILAASQPGAAQAPAVAPAARVAAPPASAKIASSPAIFPSKVDAKYASQSAGQARMHTCLDQYHSNKASHANGGMGWIQKGGGYYSMCSKKLKG